MGAGLSVIRALAARHEIDDLDLFAGTGVLDKMPDVDGAIGAGVGALVENDVVVLVEMRIMILSGWVRVGCARLLCGHEAIPSWSVPWGVSPPPGLPTLSTT